MLKSGKRVKSQRLFSKELKLKIVNEYEMGKHSVLSLSKLYSVSIQSIYNWIYKYSRYNEKSLKVVEIKDSQMEKNKQFENRIVELERALGQKQMQIDYLEKMIDLAKEEFDIDIKKTQTPNALVVPGSSRRIKL